MVSAYLGSVPQADAQATTGIYLTHVQVIMLTCSMLKVCLCLEAANAGGTGDYVA